MTINKISTINTRLRYQTSADRLCIYVMLNITIKLEFSKAIIKVPDSGLVVKYVLFDEKSKILLDTLL